MKTAGSSIANRAHPSLRKARPGSPYRASATSDSTKTPVGLGAVPGVFETPLARWVREVNPPPRDAGFTSVATIESGV